MFKKFGSGFLIIVLIVLLAVYAIVRFAGSKERTFREKVLTFDQASITDITIANAGKETVELKLSNQNWVVVTNGHEYAADSNQVRGILKQLSDLPTKRYAGKGKENWKKYEVTDSAASRVTLKSSGKILADLYIGKFSYSMPKEQQQQQYRQQQGDMTTFVRIVDEDDVYAVDGFLKMNFNRDAASFRNKLLVSVNANDITRFTSDYNGARYLLAKQENKWMMNGVQADSAQTVKYRNLIAKLSGSKFVDDAVLPATPAYSLSVEGNNFTPVLLKAYPVADTNINYIITSSANPGAFFNGKEAGLFKKIWPDPNEAPAQ